MNSINQVSFGSRMDFFKEGLKKRWKLTDYHSENEPCLFFEVGGNEERINNHKSFKLVYPVNINCLRSFKNLKPSTNLVILDRACIPVPSMFNRFTGEFEIKDYSLFKPKPLGDKIYAYIGQPSRRKMSPSGFKYEMIKNIQSNIEKEIIIAEFPSLKDYMDIKSVKSKFYDKCFLNLNFSDEAGLTSVIELAYMGIKTITNNKSNWDCMIQYDEKNYLQSIIEIIEKESIKIGTTQPPINVHTLNDNWQDVSFWENVIS
jgi:hypothetical protein